MKKVDSSNLDAIHYEPSTQILTVRFKSGGTYTYHDVPQWKYDEFEQAESLGSHLAQHIKPHHPVRKA